MSGAFMRVKVGDILVSDFGKGRLRAKVIEVFDFEVKLVRWKPGAAKPRMREFTLYRYLLEKKRTGWRLDVTQEKAAQP